MQGATRANDTMTLVIALADQAEQEGKTADDVARLLPAEWVYLRSGADHGYGPEPPSEVKEQVIAMLVRRAHTPDPFARFPKDGQP